MGQPLPDLSKIVGQMQAMPTRVNVQTSWQPGPTEVPFGGVIHLGGGNVVLAGCGGRSRLEAAATAIFAAEVTYWGLESLQRTEAIDQTVAAAESLLAAIDARSQELARASQQQSES